MRRTILSLALATTGLAQAQCDFDPTVTPNDLILCPQATAVLSTQGYDAYQWYKDGNLIAGANAQTLPVAQFNDAGSVFSVSATLNGCTEMSPEVLVDGWAFLFPYVIIGGDPQIGMGSLGELLYCEGDSVVLTMGQPYTTNVQWTNNGVPIPGANDPDFVVPANGSYDVSGAPEVCPNYVQSVGIPTDISFVAPIQPDIVVLGDSLCPYPSGTGVQWYVNGAPVATSGQCIASNIPGAYVVDVTYENGCGTPSDPYLITEVPEWAKPTERTVFPSPARDQVTISGASSIGAWQLIDATGRNAMAGDAHGNTRVTLDVRSLGEGRYWFRTNTHAARPAEVVIVR